MVNDHHLEVRHSHSLDPRAQEPEMEHPEFEEACPQPAHVERCTGAGSFARVLPKIMNSEVASGPCATAACGSRSVASWVHVLIHPGAQPPGRTTLMVGR
jgi:hypothetical protein